ncbi:helix-turn-helix domain-containing protein [Thalassobaculum litoreum]|uniref:Transcriptional regulator, AraC family n=1 Tax=Thalassobaculum litoreum DSM 18839 TaxID=1123362 RepID=A0A8G2EYP8_9PROT|nr:helix-turn-helix domain-containing protein [Thalassobaculum litoreum]SDF89456.1 transcriptional regulator, AraC family [Thalassobaculum litoreum DSM 18839]
MQRHPVTDGGTGVQRVPNTVFDVDMVARPERYDVWRDSISCIFQADADKEARGQDFHALVDANMFGPLMLARTESHEHVWRRTSAIMARDGMDHYMIQAYERGQLQWGGGLGDQTLPERGLLIVDLAQPLESRSSEFRNLSLIIPREMLDGALQSPNDQHMRVLSGEEPIVTLLRDHMVSLKNLADQMSLQQAVEIAPATVGLAAACLNTVVDEEAPSQAAGVAMAQLTVIRRFIETHLAEPALSADWIAGRVGVSRSKLYRLFDPFGGVVAYIRDRRLRRALLALSDSRERHRPIYDIALDAGYSSDAAFSRAFRSRYGVAPRDIRRTPYVYGDAIGDLDNVDRRYERWLHHLSV